MKYQRGYILGIGFNARRDYYVALGADLTEIGTDLTSTYDARAGFRLNYGGGTSGEVSTGSNPAGGGAIVTWVDDGDICTATGYTNSNFEYQWVEVSDSGVSAKVSPVAASTYEDWGATKVWYAQQTEVNLGGDSWVIDVTVREKAFSTNTGTFRVTMTVEGIV